MGGLLSLSVSVYLSLSVLALPLSMRFIRGAVIADSNSSSASRTSRVRTPCAPSGEPSVAVLVWLTELYLYRLQRSFLRGISAVGVAKDFPSPAISHQSMTLFPYRGR